MWQMFHKEDLKDTVVEAEKDNSPPPPKKKERKKEKKGLLAETRNLGQF